MLPSVEMQIRIRGCYCFCCSSRRRLGIQLQSVGAKADITSESRKNREEEEEEKRISQANTKKTCREEKSCCAVKSPEPRKERKTRPIQSILTPPATQDMARCWKFSLPTLPDRKRTRTHRKKKLRGMKEKSYFFIPSIFVPLKKSKKRRIRIGWRKG